MRTKLTRFIIITVLATFNQLSEVYATAPAGSWSASCANPNVVGTKLTANCRNNAGAYLGTELDFSTCNPVFVANCDGKLKCGECGTTQQAPAQPAPAQPSAVASQNPCEQCTTMFNQCKASGKSEDDCVLARRDCIENNADKGCGSTMGGNICEQCTTLYNTCKAQGTNEDECIQTRAECIENNKDKGCK